MTDFQKLISARFLFTLAVQMQAVIVGWQIYELTLDPLALGLVGLTEAVPALSLALYAGYIVDKSRPVRVYSLVLVGSLISALILLASGFWMEHLGVASQIVALYVASFFTGTARAFSQPSMFAVMPRLVGRDRYASSQAWMSTYMQVGRVAGPAVGGLLFGFIGFTFSFVVIVILLVGAQGFASAIRTKIEAPEKIGNLSIKIELFKGARFVFAHPVLLPAMVLDMISVMFGGVTALLPIFAKEILFVGPKGLGALRAATAVGAVFVGIYLARKPVREKTGAQLFGAVAGFGVCVLVFAASRNFYLSFAALALSGAFDGVSMVIRNTAVQLTSPENMRGRISAVSSIFIGSSNEIGEFESGIAAKFLGTVPAAYFGGVICLLTVGVIHRLSPALRNLDLTPTN